MLSSVTAVNDVSWRRFVVAALAELFGSSRVGDYLIICVPMLTKYKIRNGVQCTNTRLILHYLAWSNGTCISIMETGEAFEAWRR